MEHHLSAEGADPLILAGVGDANLREVATLFGVRVVMRGDYVRLAGGMEAVADSARVVEHMIELARLGKSFPPADVARFAVSLEARGGPDIRSADERLQIRVPGSRRRIAPRSEGQRAYLEAMDESDIVIGIGPAGTGKTYLAVARAVDALFRKRVRRIILARPAVEAGENLGFLPGDLQEKVDPYLRPLYDALEDMMPAARVRRGIGERSIEVVPLAYMRGRTLSDAFVILDEAQNATASQMKMFLTRIGVNSRVVITGDKTQIDLPSAQMSGLVHIEEVLRRRRRDRLRLPGRERRDPSPARQVHHPGLLRGRRPPGAAGRDASATDGRSGTGRMAVRRFLRRHLSGPPPRAWPGTGVYHGARWLLLLSLAVMLAVVFPSGAVVRLGTYEAGTVATDEVNALFAFDVPKSDSVLRIERAAATAAVVPTFRFREEAWSRTTDRLGAFFARADSAFEVAGAAGVTALLIAEGIPADSGQIAVLADAEAASALQAAAQAAAARLVDQGVTEPAAASELESDSIRIVTGGAARVAPSGPKCCRRASSTTRRSPVAKPARRPTCCGRCWRATWPRAWFPTRSSTPRPAARPASRCA